MTRPIDIRCTECEHGELDVWHEYGTQYGVCPECGAGMTRWYRSSGGAHGDDIPGGLAVPHAVCHPDGTPRVFYSKKEILKEAKARGWTNVVEHIPSSRGTDKSKHTTRWF